MTISTLGGPSAGTDNLIRQYVSDPIVGAQTIAGTLKGQIRMLESYVFGWCLPQVFVRIFSNDGSTVRGTSFAGDIRTTNVDEISSSALTNIKIPGAGISPVTLSSVSALDGDRIVVEIGTRQNTTFTSTDVDTRFGDNSGSDLSEGGTETTDLCPWVEFSANINFTALAGGFPFTGTTYRNLQGR